MDCSLNLSKDLLFEEVVQKLIELKLKNSTDQVRPIPSGLSDEQILLNLPPLWIASEGQKQVRLSKFADNRHRILVQLQHLTGAALMSRWQNESLADVAGGLTFRAGIHQPFVKLSPQFPLLISQKVQSNGLDVQPFGNDILMK